MRRTNLLTIALAGACLVATGPLAACSDDGDGGPSLNQSDGVDGPDTVTGDGGEVAGDTAGPGDDADPDAGPDPDEGAEAVCGDGECAEGEDVVSCRADCPAPPFLACLAESCDETLGACLDLDDCAHAVSCALGCGPDNAECIETCAGDVTQSAGFIFDQVMACGEEGGCTDAPPAADSCEGRCDTYDEDAPCNCDEDCALFDDCCDDYASVCLGEGPECGDGVCEGEETPETCAEDCPTDPPTECGDGACEGMEAMTCPEDCGGSAECGDGVCSGEETAESCPADCDTVTPGACGDGTCDSKESAESCPEDCDGTPPPSEILACVEDSCASEYAACQADAACAQILACVAACEDPASLDCQMGCSGGGLPPQTAVDVALCAQESGCLEGGGDPPGPLCGDGVCNGEETAESCAIDCGGESSPLITCLVQGGCSAQLDACQAEPACAQVLPCLEACVEAGQTGCTQKCGDEHGWSQELQALGQCGGQAGCGNPPDPGACGDGVCGDGETMQSCPQDCGEEPPACGDGQCGWFENADNCPEDCGGTPGACGDGTCGEGEDATSCPADCEALPSDPIECLGQTCGAELDACMASESCLGFLACVPGCVGDLGCVYECGQDAGFAGEVIDISLCASSSGCFE